VIYSRLNSQEWSSPVIIAEMPGINNCIDLCIDHAGVEHVVWAHKVSQIYWIIMYSKSNDGGDTWSEPDTIVNYPDSWLYEPHIDCDTLNNIFVSYDSISYDGGYGQVFLLEFDGIQWTTPIRLSGNNSSKGNKIDCNNDNRLFVFWHEIHNVNAKFAYRYMEGGLWSEINFPYSDSNVYVLENLDIDKQNNIHCVGYFNYFGQTSYDMVIFYSSFDYINDLWQPVQLLSAERSTLGCDISVDTMSLPCITWCQYTNSSLPYEYATLFKNQSLNGWEVSDTINHDRESNLKIALDINNNIHIIDYYTFSGSITSLNYYSINDDTWTKEIIDEGGTILFYDLEVDNENVNIAYGKRTGTLGNDTTSLLFVKKTVTVNTEKVINSDCFVKIYPNPTSNVIKINFTLKYPTIVNIWVIDINGNYVISLRIPSVISIFHKMRRGFIFAQAEVCAVD
jgi:hypothetical protein